MSNQDRLLSDEKLENFIEKCWRDLITKDEALAELKDLINTQKRLYAASVIDTSKEILLTNNNTEFEAGYIKGREDLRAEQRARMKL